MAGAPARSSVAWRALCDSQEEVPNKKNAELGDVGGLAQGIPDHLSHEVAGSLLADLQNCRTLDAF